VVRGLGAWVWGWVGLGVGMERCLCGGWVSGGVGGCGGGGRGWGNVCGEDGQREHMAGRVDDRVFLLTPSLK